MQKNTERALQAWRVGVPSRPSPSVWTDGETIYSYGTAILTKPPCEPAVVNMTGYSVTTNAHQRAILERLSYGGSPVLEVRGLPRGATRDDLLSAAKRHGEAICPTV